MASFEDLPAEVVHYIVQFLAPTCCEDPKQDILAFRAVQKRTWHIANQIAFKYMTLSIYDPSRSSTLGTFGRRAKVDAFGYDIRNCVQEVRYLLRPMLPFIGYVTRIEREKLYKSKAFQTFSLLLDKQAQDLDRSERRARQHYWELCIKPYVNEASSASIVKRIVKDLAGFSMLQTMSTDSEYHLLNTSSIAWQELEKIGISDMIWDKSKGRFRPDGIGHGSFPFVHVEQLHSTILAALPPSVTRLKSKDFAKYQSPSDHDRPARPRPPPQITEIVAVVHQDTHKNPFLRFRDEILFLPNLETLRLRADKTRAEQCRVRGFHLAMITGKFRDYSLNALRTLHLSGYVASRAEFIHTLEFAAHHNIALILENMVLVETNTTHDPNGRPLHLSTDRITIITQDTRQFLSQLAELARVCLQDHLSRGRARVRIQGELTCLPVKGTEFHYDFWTQTITGAALALFEDLLHTEEQEEAFLEEVEKAPLERVETSIIHMMYFDVICKENQVRRLHHEYFV